MPTAVVILAAGKGSRMKSDLPKVLHPLAGAPLLAHAVASARSLAPEKIVVVAGHGADEVRTALAGFAPDVEVVVQAEQLGTGHAVAQARSALEGFTGNVVVLYGDTPLISQPTLEKMCNAHERHGVVVLGFEAADPGRYGRLVMAENSLERIVEYKDASTEERSITLCNSGVISADCATMFALLERVNNQNAAGEYYLTDIIALARSTGQRAGVVVCPESETMGVNSRGDLAAAEAAWQRRARLALLDTGVSMAAPESVFLSYDTEIAEDCFIEQHVVFGPGVRLAPNVRVRAFSHLEGAHVEQGAVIGPYARLRPGAEIGARCHVGNFVEIKKSVLHEGVKASHLTYIGDAEIGARTNIGAGTVTCNYDGVRKHRTEVGQDVFIGSSTMLVAPVNIGSGAMTASGSVITRDVSPDSLVLGRARQIEKPGLAKRLKALWRGEKT